MTQKEGRASRRLAIALPWWALGLAVAVTDFATKQAVRLQWPEGTVVPVTSFFNLVSVQNAGAAFSMLADAGGWQRHFLAALAVVVSAVLLWLLTSPLRRLEAAGYSLILGGAVGNAIDRIVYGSVTDFLDFHVLGMHWPAFNGADIAICLGAASMIGSALIGTPAANLQARSGRL
jgi:signal peptidase II